jgi:2-iminoacetate synthase ThiH
MFKMTDCVYAKDCRGNCGGCNFYVSKKPQNRDKDIMDFVTLYHHAPTEEYKQEIKDLAKKYFTTKEYGVFLFEIKGYGI